MRQGGWEGGREGGSNQVMHCFKGLSHVHSKESSSGKFSYQLTGVLVLHFVVPSLQQRMACRSSRQLPLGI